MNFIEPDIIGAAARVLLVHVQPVLLFHGVAAALVIAILILLAGFLAGGIVQSFAQEHSGGRATRNGPGFPVGQLAANGRAARAQHHVAYGAGGATTAEESSDSKSEDEVYGFHKGVSTGSDSGLDRAPGLACLMIPSTM